MYKITEALAANIVQNIEDQLNDKKMSLIALQKEINHLETLKSSVVNSKSIEHDISSNGNQVKEKA